jgi:hypothetical protein
VRGFTDGGGRAWDAMVGRESWGALVLLFSPRGEGGNRTLPLPAETVREAEAALATLTDDELRARLADSQPWTG